MASNLDTSAIPGSLTARRPAATNLGSMSLPPLPFRQTTPQKPMAFFENSGPNQTSNYNGVGNLLTPPTGSDNMSPLSSMVNGSNGQSLQSTSPSNWPQSTAFSLSGMAATGITPPSWSQTKKGPFSPPLADALHRTDSNSPGAQDIGSSPSLNDLNAFSTNIDAPLNAVAAANQQAFAQNSLPFGVSEAPPPSDANGEQTSLSSPPGFGIRSSSTPNNYPFTNMPSNGSAQSNGFNFNSPTSSTQQPPLSAPLIGRNNFSPSPTGVQQQYPLPGAMGYFRPPYAYSLAAQNGQVPLPGPIMTNMNNPNHQMHLMGVPQGIPPMMHGYHSGHAASMYGAQPPHVTTERPFKCDVCPQSFNRNHDLKRHKRIHLAVKPFPCGYCDKSFSRKDALKRHILVKGCGKNEKSGKEDRPTKLEQGDSPEPRSPSDAGMNEEQ